MTDTPNDARTAARKRIEERRGFFPHVLAYLVINAGLVLIWWATGADGFFWPGIIMVGWGLGVVMHAWNAFFARPITEADVDRELQRMAGRTDDHKTT